MVMGILEDVKERSVNSDSDSEFICKEIGHTYIHMHIYIDTFCVINNVINSYAIFQSQSFEHY